MFLNTQAAVPSTFRKISIEMAVAFLKKLYTWDYILKSRLDRDRSLVTLRCHTDVNHA